MKLGTHFTISLSNPGKRGKSKACKGKHDTRFLSTDSLRETRMNTLIKSYYRVRRLVPRNIQIQLRKRLARHQQATHKDTWPIDPKSADARPPWDDWPGGKRFTLVLTHDVETEEGLKKCYPLMKLEQEMGFRSSFNFVPERYSTPPLLREMLQSDGFEVGVHGLSHDGKLYHSKKIFMERAAKINGYLGAWNAAGFRSPSMHHNLEWLHELNVRYDSSTFDTDPFEPDNTGLGTIFPQWISRGEGKGGYVELPYTLPQDSTLYLILQHEDIGIWKQKLDWIAKEGGMALLNTHPDYMDFSPHATLKRHYPTHFYREWLEYIDSKYKNMYWHALPHEVADFASRKYQRK